MTRTKPPDFTYNCKWDMDGKHETRM